MAYAGNFMQLLASQTTSTALAANEVNISTIVGGWGVGTAGLLTGVLNMEKSFGTFGADIAGTGMVAQGGSFSSVPAAMNTNRGAGTPNTNCANALNCANIAADASVNPSYLVVSIIPVAYGAAAWA